MTKRYYPSSAAFATGRLVHTEYNSGCLRKIYFADRGIREQLRQDTKDVGHENEEAYEARLRAAGVSFSREVAIRTDDGLGSFSGRVDFVTQEGTPDAEIVELKSTRSDTKRRRLKEGAPYIENIAQLLAYMIELEIPRGRLIYTYYGVNGRTKKSTQEDFEFAVTVDGFGDVYVNGRRWAYSVYDHLMHRILVAESQPLPERPYGYEKNFGSPCNYCVFKQVCGLYDCGAVNTEQEILTEAAAVVASKQ